MLVILTLLTFVQVVFADWRCWYNPYTTIEGGIYGQGSYDIENCWSWSGCSPCRNVNQGFRNFRQQTSCGFRRSYSDGCSMPDFDIGFGSAKSFWYEACVQHDYCYSDVGSPYSRLQCDAALGRNMRALCQSLDYWSWKSCVAASYTAVSVLVVAPQGQEAFDYDREYCGARNEPWNGYN